MNNFGFITKNGIVVGENTKIQGNTLTINSIVSLSYASNVQIGTSDIVVDTSNKNITRSAKYQLEIIGNSEYQVSELLLIQDGTTSKFTEYGILTTGQLPIATFTTDVVGNNVLLLARMNSGTGRIWFSKTSINTVQAEIPIQGLGVTDRSGAAVTDRNNEPIEVRAA